jgi:decaprenylphospho-beta-D-erythro-pentofuranosid-2-ulose 2-reductase
MTVALSRAIVVGASSGIGEAIAHEMARTGVAAIALVARRQNELHRVAGVIKHAHPEIKVQTYMHDVVDFDQTAPLFERIERDLGGVDSLVYAAGVMPEVVEGEYSFTKDRAMIEVNLLGAMAWMDVAAARFEAARRGTILGISSIAGERGRRGNPGYNTSKAALSTFLEALRNRMSRYGVNVVTIKPGFVDTAMTRGKGIKGAIPAEEAARRCLSIARAGGSGSAFVPGKWALVALVIRSIPSFLFRHLNL